MTPCIIPVTAGRIGVAINSDGGGRHTECLTHLLVKLKVGYCAPVFRCCGEHVKTLFEN